MNLPMKFGSIILYLLEVIAWVTGSESENREMLFLGSTQVCHGIHLNSGFIKLFENEINSRKSKSISISHICGRKIMISEIIDRLIHHSQVYASPEFIVIMLGNDDVIAENSISDNLKQNTIRLISLVIGMKPKMVFLSTPFTNSDSINGTSFFDFIPYWF